MEKQFSVTCGAAKANSCQFLLRGFVSLLAALILALAHQAAADSPSATLLSTFANPPPAAGDAFGYSVTALGSDRVLVGAYRDDTGAANAGAAYLFSTGGVLVTTFTDPLPAPNGGFGYAVAAVGGDRVLIGNPNPGLYQPGAAYLFTTNGAWRTTFTSPMPHLENYFGSSVAAVGTDRVLVGATGDNTGATAAGAAYLFTTNGALVTIFPNPAPSNGAEFGHAVAAVGTDRVLISAVNDDTGAVDAGIAYLFNTAGTLLATFTNPHPTLASHFGSSVAAVATDRVLIGSPKDDTGATDAGAAYLFSTNGTLLTIFANPAPADGDQFGSSVAALGNDRVLIGACGADPDAADSGAAYLFSTDGTRLATVDNPAPATGDYFGGAVAALGTNLLLIGAQGADAGATDAGAAYLFALTPGTNANLAGLLLSAGTLTPAFDAAVINYTAAVPSGTNSVTVRPTSADPDPVIQVRVNGGAFSNVVSGTASPALPLNVGINNIDVRVTASDNSATKTYTVAVTRMPNQRPVANAGGDRVGYTGDCVPLNGSASYDPDGEPIVEWIWTVAVAPPLAEWALMHSEMPVAHLCAYTPGQYLVSLFVSDPSGFSVPDVITVTIADNLPPVAIATADRTEGPAPLVVQFDGSQSYDPEGKPLAEYFWDFGDGSPGSYAATPPPHTYSMPGSSSVVILGVTDERGAVGSDTIVITVTEPLPVLRVARSNTNTVRLAWSAYLIGFGLQENSELTTANWQAVTNAPVLVGDEKQVIVSPPTRNRFYRLNKP